MRHTGRLQKVPEVGQDCHVAATLVILQKGNDALSLPPGRESAQDLVIDHYTAVFFQLVDERDMRGPLEKNALDRLDNG